MKKHNCPVHGNHPIDQEHAHIPEPQPDCTCDVGITGPAGTGGNVPTGPALEGKGNTPTGPAAEGKGNTPGGPAK